MPPKPHPGIHREHFSYDASGFLAKAPGETVAYPRDDPKQLQFVLTVQTTVQGDASLAYYRAQLVHYGLRPFTKKTDAKNHLLRARLTLTVPDVILQFEREMKAEWEKSQADHKEDADTNTAEAGSTPAADSAQSEDAVAGAVGEATVDRTLKRKSLPTSSEGEATAKRSKMEHSLDWTDVVGKFAITPLKMAEVSDSDSAGTDTFLEVAYSRTPTHLWMNLQLGDISATLRATALADNGRSEFLWRGSAGSSQYANDSCRGSVTFLGHGKLRGDIRGGPLTVSLEFAGQQCEKPRSKYNDAVMDWKEHYHSLNASVTEPIEGSFDEDQLLSTS